MGIYKEFEKIIFDFTSEAAELGGQTAVDQFEYGHIFHFEDKDAISFLEKNAAQLSESSLKRLKGNLDATILEGVRAGKPIKEITKDVTAVFDNVKGFEAERIARTEVSRGVNNGALIGYDNMGVKVVEYYANAGACPICDAHQGDLMTLDQAMNFIPVHPNCYCFWLPRPDIANKNVKGWKSLGEMSNKVVKGLGTELAFQRVSMAPETLKKIAIKSESHLQEAETARLVVEHASMGYIDERGQICLIMDMMDMEKNFLGFVPVKSTEDMGLVAMTAYRMGPKQLKRNLKKAGKTYGF